MLLHSFSKTNACYVYWLYLLTVINSDDRRQQMCNINGKETRNTSFLAQISRICDKHMNYLYINVAIVYETLVSVMIMQNNNKKITLLKGR